MGGWIDGWAVGRAGVHACMHVCMYCMHACMYVLHACMHVCMYVKHFLSIRTSFSREFFIHENFFNEKEMKSSYTCILSGESIIEK